MTIRVILIEDYRLVRVGITSLLSRGVGIEVVGEAETGEEGLELIKQLKPDVAIVDLGLPGMDGIEVTQQIKLVNKETKVIILTSHENEEEVYAALSAGANAYCLKDNTSNRFIEIIKDVNDGAAWLDPKIAQYALKLFDRDSLQQVSDDAKEELRNKLTPRELEVLELLVEGKTNAEIAKELYLSVHTIKLEVTNILQKLAVNDRVQAAVKAVRAGIVA